MTAAVLGLCDSAASKKEDNKNYRQSDATLHHGIFSHFRQTSSRWAIFYYQSIFPTRTPKLVRKDYVLDRSCCTLLASDENGSQVPALKKLSGGVYLVRKRITLGPAVPQFDRPLTIFRPFLPTSECYSSFYWHRDAYPVRLVFGLLNEVQPIAELGVRYIVSRRVGML